MKPIALWPQQERRGIRGVLTDIDDTLTTYGRLTPEVLTALMRLRATGLTLVAVTGRPTYWALSLLRLCGLHAVIAENGASAFWLDEKGIQQSLFYADAPTRQAHRRALEAFAHQMQKQFPHIRVADDAPQRVGDLAFDIGENIAPLPAQEVREVLAFMRSHGLHATASSIHAHASLAPFSKQVMSERVLAEVFGVDDASARQTFAFIGDSGNDAPMFSHYPHSAGVANVAAHLHCLPTPPAYVTQQAYGAGFVEAADAILQSKAS
jgi:HAD superfamily hydrolase (TIGR01484 family)